MDRPEQKAMAPRFSPPSIAECSNFAVRMGLNGVDFSETVIGHTCC